MQLSQKAFTRVQAIDPDSVLVHEMSGQMMEDMSNYDGALGRVQEGSRDRAA